MQTAAGATAAGACAPATADTVAAPADDGASTILLGSAQYARLQAYSDASPTLPRRAALPSEG